MTSNPETSWVVTSLISAVSVSCDVTTFLVFRSLGIYGLPKWCLSWHCFYRVTSMLKLKSGSNTGSDTVTRDPTRLGQNRWSGDPVPSLLKIDLRQTDYLLSKVSQWHDYRKNNKTDKTTTAVYTMSKGTRSSVLSWDTKHSDEKT